MTRVRFALLGATLVLSSVMVAIPAMAATTSVSWDHAGGLSLDLGVEELVASLDVPDPDGAACTAEVEAVNGNSRNRDIDIIVKLNGGPLMSLQDIENVSGQVTPGSAGFVSTGSDVLTVFYLSTQSTVASSAGTLTVTCEEPPGGGEGCTPGYWKQEHHFDSWAATGFEPGDSYDVVFGVDGSVDTLLDGLKAKGGGEKALARHAVAALLNALNPDVSFEFTALEVIALVQDAYGSGDYEAAKDILAEQNETGCPLN